MGSAGRSPALIITLAAVLLLTGCAPRAIVLGLAPTALPQPTAAEEARTIGLRLAEADALADRGAYTTLKRAAAIYRDVEAGPTLHDQSVWLDRAAESLLRTTLLITVREKDLSILSLAGIDEARRIISAGQERFKAYPPSVDIAGLFWAQGEGITRNADERFQPGEVMPRLIEREAGLAEAALEDAFHACMYATFLRMNPQAPGREPKRLQTELDTLAQAHPDSFVIRDLLARLPQPNSKALEELATEEPEYHEVGYYLGEMALGAGLLLLAEKHLLPAHAAIPESPRIPMLLGAVAFALEEFDRGLAFYDKAIARAPESRDALLGRAVCLSFLARHEEALRTLQTMIDLGSVMLGEAHFWTAWNLRALGRRPAAEAHVAEAKARLPADTQVFWLSGMLALDRGDLDTAEKEFLESLRFSTANVESLYQLGVVYAKKRDWLPSGRYYSLAADGYQRSIEALIGKIEQVQAAELAEERKTRLLRRLGALRRTMELTQATCWFNAAAGFHNGGQNALARPNAERACAHPAFKTMAEELLVRLK